MTRAMTKIANWMNMGTRNDSKTQTSLKHKTEIQQQNRYQEKHTREKGAVI